MAIERLTASTQLPLITQRLDISNATPLLPGAVMPLVPLGPYMAPAPDAGVAPGQLMAQLLDGQAGAGTAAAKADPGATARDSSAMQVNQLFFTRQLVWRPPDAGQLGASWRVMVRTYGEQYAALQEQARGQHVPANLLMAEQNPALLREPGRAPAMLESEAWRFVVYGWGGQRLMLRLLPRDQEEDENGLPRRRSGKVALRLELLLDGYGKVVVQMEVVAGGVLLELAAFDPQALHALRGALPDIAEAMGRAGLRIVRCRLNRELHANRVPQNFPMQAAASALPAPLFRAMAEVALLLSRPAATAAAPSQPVPSVAAAEAQEVEEAVPVSKEVPAPMWHRDEQEAQHQGEEELDAEATARLFALPAPDDLLPPIDEQD